MAPIHPLSAQIQLPNDAISLIRTTTSVATTTSTAIAQTTTSLAETPLLSARHHSGHHRLLKVPLHEMEVIPYLSLLCLVIGFTVVVSIAFRDIFEADGEESQRSRYFQTQEREHSEPSEDDSKGEIGIRASKSKQNRRERGRARGRARGRDRAQSRGEFMEPLVRGSDREGAKRGGQGSSRAGGASPVQEYGTLNRVSSPESIAATNSISQNSSGKKKQDRQIGKGVLTNLSALPCKKDKALIDMTSESAAPKHTKSMPSLTSSDHPNTETVPRRESIACTSATPKSAPVTFHTSNSSQESKDERESKGENRGMHISTTKSFTWADDELRDGLTFSQLVGLYGRAEVENMNYGGEVNETGGCGWKGKGKLNSKVVHWK